jgi:lipopolysaccharide transport system permease protein
MFYEQEVAVLTSSDAPSSNPLEEASMVFPEVNQKQLAWLDLKEGLAQWRVWLMLAYQDIKLRYRRSVLGPFWLTISMAITIYSMGFLYAHLFHIKLETYYPFLTAGMLGWTLISTAVIELTDGLLTQDGLIKQIKLPYSLYIHRIASRNLIIFFHNILVIIPILVMFHSYVKVNWHDLLLIPGLIIIYFNAISYGLILSMIGARYRDISQIIKSLVQVIFFITPVMWAPEVLGRQYYFVDLNPVYAFLELIRAPLLGTAPTLQNLVIVALMTGLGLMVCLKMFARYRARIVYWL